MLHNIITLYLFSRKVELNIFIPNKEKNLENRMKIWGMANDREVFQICQKNLWCRTNIDWMNSITSYEKLIIEYAKVVP